MLLKLDPHAVHDHPQGSCSFVTNFISDGEVAAPVIKTEFMYRSEVK